MQGGLASWAQEWIGVPDPEDEVAPKRTRRAGDDFGGQLDERWFRRGVFFSGGVRPSGGWAWHAAAFVQGNLGTDHGDRNLGTDHAAPTEERNPDGMGSDHADAGSALCRPP